MKLHKLPTVKNISKKHFMEEYHSKESPLHIQGLTSNWRAYDKWSLEYFEELGGEQEVKLYNSTPATGNKLQHAAQTTMPLKEYFRRIKEGEKDLRIFFFDLIRELPILQKDFSFPDIGLEWFKKLPVMFVGGAGAKVQMHFDIDYADIFLCHFGGKKRVRLFSPEQTPLMYHVPFSFSSLFDVDYDNPDYEKHPALKKLEGYEVILEHGDILYIPPGWWHYIVYEEIGYSMAIRAFPRKLKPFYKMIRNLLWTRSADGLMRLVLGDKWNNRNASLAITRTHQYLAKRA